MVLIQSFHFPCILSNVLLETKTILKKSYESCSFDFEKKRLFAHELFIKLLNIVTLAELAVLLFLGCDLLSLYSSICTSYKED